MGEAVVWACTHHATSKPQPKRSSQHEYCDKKQMYQGNSSLILQYNNKQHRTCQYNYSASL